MKKSIPSNSAGVRLGDASERLRLALSKVAPHFSGRKALLDSPALAFEHHKEGGERLSVREHRAAAKVLGRLIEDGAVREVLVLRGNSEKIQLPEAGIVAVSVSLTSLNQAFRDWKIGEGPAPTQEEIVKQIIQRSMDWMKANAALSPVYLVNTCIVHGSGAFDILVTVLYRNSHDFMRYIRHVIQRIEHVSGTHTMQISTSYGFLEIPPPSADKLAAVS